VKTKKVKWKLAANLVWIRVPVPEQHVHALVDARALPHGLQLTTNVCESDI